MTPGATRSQALGTVKSLLFVGCGPEGLSDPNFGNFLTWLAALDADSQHRHYQLVRESKCIPPRGRLFPLVYGEDYADLLPFLESLRLAIHSPQKASLQQGI
jgi:hypothetical protein